MNERIPPTGLPIPFEQTLPPTKWPEVALPDGMREAALAIAEHVQAPKPLAAFAVISAVAHVAQRLADADRPTGGQMPCSLFVLSQAKSGDRKSECYRIASNPITDYERELRQSHKDECRRIEKEAEGQKKKEAAAILAKMPQDPRTTYTEATLEAIARDFVKGSRPALSLSTDEGGQFFGGHSMKADTRAHAMGTLTKLFDGGGIDRNRVGENSGTGFRYNVRFSLFLSVQPVVVRDSLNDQLMQGQGLLARFLFSASPSIAGTRILDKEKLAFKASANADIQAYWHTLEKMNRLQWKTDEYDGLVLPVVPLTEDALGEWLAKYNEIESKQAKGGSMAGLMEPFAGRAGELARRVATMFALWRHHHEENGALEVDGMDMARAWALVQYSLSEWKKQFSVAGSNLSPTERDAFKLLNFMQQDSGRWHKFTRAFIAQNCLNQLRGSENKSRRDAAIDELVKRHWLIEAGSDLILQNPVPNAATAISAIPATPNSNSSRNSNSNPSTDC